MYLSSFVLYYLEGSSEVFGFATLFLLSHKLLKHNHFTYFQKNIFIIFIC